jgi:hypothetical protein
MGEYDVTTSYLFRHFAKDFVEGLIHDVNFVKTVISEEIMLQSSVVQDLLKKTLAQSVLFAVETKLGTLDDTTKDRILSIQDEELLNHLHRQAVVSSRNELVKRRSNN